MTESNSLNAHPSNPLNRIIGTIRNVIKSNQDNEMKYWTGRLGRTFIDYDEMRGARDHYIMEQKRATRALNPEPTKTIATSTSPWSLMSLGKKETP